VSILGACIKTSVALALTSVTIFTTSASGQSPAAQPNSTVAVSEPKPGSAENSPSAQPSSGAAPQTNNDRYRDGIVIWETPADAKVPFLLKFNINTQLRYLNTQDSDTTFTDHLGVGREVHTRNDITVNRAMFILGGYIFDQRARYSFSRLDVRRGRFDRRCQQHWLAIQQGHHDYRRLHWRSRQSITGQHVPVFYGDR
jgi:hypothetical protein